MPSHSARAASLSATWAEVMATSGRSRYSVDCRSSELSDMAGLDLPEPSRLCSLVADLKFRSRKHSPSPGRYHRTTSICSVDRSARKSARFRSIQHLCWPGKLCPLHRPAKNGVELAFNFASERMEKQSRPVPPPPQAQTMSKVLFHCLFFPFRSTLLMGSENLPIESACRCFPGNRAHAVVC